MTTPSPMNPMLAASVVIPTRNRSSLLRECIDSILCQTMPPDRFEIVIVDNNSSDDTPAVVEQWIQSAPCRIRYHRLTRDCGPAHARNVGVRLAEAPLIAFTDSDCRADQRWLELGVAAFADGVGFVCGVLLHKPEQKVQFFSGAYDELTSEHPTYPTCNSIYRRDLFLEMNGFDESLCFRTFFDNKPVECADTDLAWRIKEAGWRNVFLPNLVMYHEVPLRTPLNWIVDPYRIYSVPALVKRHPGLRKVLLQGGVFFRFENALFYVAAAGVVLGALLNPWFLLLCAPYPILLASILRHNLSLTRLPKLFAQLGLLTARQACLSAGLVYGSIRFRSLVL